MQALTARTLLVCGTLLAAGCTPEALESAGAPLPAYCSARVQGLGNVDVETRYLPRVVQCENGAASFEALKAQAVAARSYLYYRLRRVGYIGDGESDQVYSCGRTPSPDHVAAVRETAGLVVNHGGSTVATFYVAGGEADAPSCRGDSPGVADTERFVTYNEGREGGEVEPSPIGNTGDPQNRGCMSQNGADCLSDDGWSYVDILQFYYGDDVVPLMRATGPCVDPNAAYQPEPRPPEPDPAEDPAFRPDDPPDDPDSPDDDGAPRPPDPAPETTPFNSDCICDLDGQCNADTDGDECECDPDCWSCDCDVSYGCDSDARGCDCGCDYDCGGTFEFNRRCACDTNFECNADSWGCGCGCDPDCE